MYLSYDVRRLAVPTLFGPGTLICVRIATDMPSKFRQPPVSYSTYPADLFSISFLFNLAMGGGKLKVV